MKLSKTELLLLEQVAKGNKDVKTIARSIKKSNKQVYLTINSLKDKNILESAKRELITKDLLHLSLLLQMLSNNPNLVPVLSDSGIPILTELLSGFGVKSVEKNTKLKKSIIYRKLQEANKRSMIKKADSGFMINERLWPKLKEFLEELNKYESMTDPRIPASATIYWRKNKTILFSCKEELDATKTAFSAYENLGIKLLLTKNYYSLPKKELTIKKIIKDSLLILEHEKDSRNLVFLAIFYAKYRAEINLKQKVLSGFDSVFAKKRVKGYPSYDEIKEKAEVYGVKI